jgi:signal transduction histidine kinase
MAFAWSPEERQLIYRRGLGIRSVAAGAFLVLLLSFRLAGWGGHISGQVWLEALLLVLIAINPFLWVIGRSREFRLADFNVHWAIDIAAVTAAVYFCGSLDVPLATCAYIIMIVTSATFANRRTSLQLASWSAVALVGLVGSEELGMIPHQHVLFAAHLTREGKIATVGIAITCFVVFGYIAGILAEQLRRKAEAVEDQKKSLEVAYEKEQASREGMELLSALVQHDVYSPLGIVSGACGEALKSCEEGDLVTCEHFVRMIADRLHSIESAVATLGLFELSKGAAPTTGFDLRVMTEEIVEDLRAEWTERKVRVVVEGEWPLICIKRQHVYHVLRNLLSNSVKSVENDGNGWIRVFSGRSRGGDGEASLSVIDNGPGVSNEARARLFSLREVKGPKRSGEGLGAGLALSENVVRKWGGELTYQPKEGRGSNFTVTFPKETVARWL